MIFCMIAPKFINYDTPRMGTNTCGEVPTVLGMSITQQPLGEEQVVKTIDTHVKGDKIFFQ